MTRWRLCLSIVLVLLIGLPALMPFIDLVQHPVAWRAWEESHRLFRLAGNTMLLVVGTLLIALPAGIALAALLYRTDLPWRRLLRRLMLLALFIPLPLVASGWQAALGSGGWLATTIWNAPFPRPLLVTDPDNPYLPWGQGLAAVWIHAMAALPWVVLLCGQAFCWIERELEDNALLDASACRVFLRVTLVRSRPTIVLAALWIAAQVATEITVTNMMQVRTYAEEVYVQMVRPELRSGLGANDLVARAVAVSIPAVLVMLAVVFSTANRWERSLPPLLGSGVMPRLFSLGRWRVAAWLLSFFAVSLVLGIPLGSLVWRAGLLEQPRRWSAATAGYYLNAALRLDGQIVAWSLFQGLLAGIALAILALLAAWLTRGAPRLRKLLLVLLALAWALPGPVVGLGLKQFISLMLDLTRDPKFLLVALHRGPSPVPVMWVQTIRFFPCAVALIWPVVRTIPGELYDAASLDGAAPGQQLGHVIGPLALPACLRTILAVTILSLGELSASKLVEPAASPTFADVLFMKMHFGVKNDLAAYCLMLFSVVVVCGSVLWIVDAWSTRSNAGTARP